MLNVAVQPWEQPRSSKRVLPGFSIASSDILVYRGLVYNQFPFLYACTLSESFPRTHRNEEGEGRISACHQQAQAKQIG
jgi:hypothetical protein